MPRRLIEEAFPLQKVSQDSKHEKDVHHGHISSLHVWPARRPLATCRAVVIATLLPDPADAPETMKVEYTRLSGSLLPDKQREYLCYELIASLTRWGDENGHGHWGEKDQKGRWVNKLRIARELIQMAYNGRPPNVMDLFAGGGAIPLEAMRLGYKAIANDYNPVAQFILKCTLEYPQQLAGKTHPLPELKLCEYPDLKGENLVAHVRLWGQWILENARSDLDQYYPVIDEKPTVAYLWARTIPCQDPTCGGTVPLLKILWVCKKAEKILPNTAENQKRSDFLRLKKTKNQTKIIINSRRALKLCPDFETKRVYFEIIAPKDGGDVGEPTMSGATATCPFCCSQQPDDYIKQCGHDGKLKAQMTTIVYQEERGREYRPPTQPEIDAAEISEEALGVIANQIPHGMPDEPMPGPETLGFRAPLYGFKKWSDIFTVRQLLALMTFVKWTYAAQRKMQKMGYSSEWSQAISGYVACVFDRMLDFSSTLISWISSVEAIGNTFKRYALPVTWDFSEGAIPNNVCGGYQLCLDKILSSMETISNAHTVQTPSCVILRQSASHPINIEAEAVITDPPYYDAIPYADLSDFFYVWLRRMVGNQFSDILSEPLTPKISELVQHIGRFGKNRAEAKKFYEKGVSESFQSAYQILSNDGRMVVVFAHKDPEAWETLVKAMIESGLVVTTSWPIDTERGARTRAHRSAALGTSLWLVCRKRSPNARAGHYGKVKKEMQERITERLRYFWDAGIQGPDFVWAAIGPALESYSSYNEVRRMDGRAFTIAEFLTEVRRIVTDFALGQILHGASTEALDEWTRYYLMHMNHFGTGDAPVGECILLAQGYGLSLDDLTEARIGILKKASSGSALRLLGHTDRDSDRIGEPHTSGGLPVIDMLHRIMNLWKAGDQTLISAYLTEHGLRENDLFKFVVQALIEMNPQGSDERALLEAIINYNPNLSARDTEQQLTIREVLS